MVIGRRRPLCYRHSRVIGVILSGFFFYYLPFPFLVTAFIDDALCLFLSTLSHDIIIVCVTRVVVYTGSSLLVGGVSFRFFGLSV